MQQNTTSSDSSDPEVSPTQMRVLSALATGTTISAAAEAASVDRTTVHRWLREDACFQAAWNRLRLEMRREVAARLDHLAEAALNTVQGAMEAGDARIALAVLKGVGVLGGRRPAIGPDDPEVVEEEADLAQAETEAVRRHNRLLAYLAGDVSAHRYELPGRLPSPGRPSWDLRPVERRIDEGCPKTSPSNPGACTGPEQMSGVDR